MALFFLLLASKWDKGKECSIKKKALFLTAKDHPMKIYIICYLPRI
jgi:hypothetical protein